MKDPFRSLWWSFFLNTTESNRNRTNRSDTHRRAVQNRFAAPAKDGAALKTRCNEVRMETTRALVKPQETATRWSESPRHWPVKGPETWFHIKDPLLWEVQSWSYGVALWPSRMASVRSTNQTKTPDFLTGSAGEVRHVLHIHQVVNREFIPHLHQVIPNLCSPPEPLPQIPPSEFVHFEKLKRSQKINAGGQPVPASRAAVLELSDLTLP